MNYLLKIDAFYDTLSNKEKIIADYIKESGNLLMYETLSEVAKKLNVGEATIMRFCHKLKFAGFQDLKLEIAKYTSSDEESTNKSSIISGKVNSLITTIKATETTISIEDLNIASNYIKDAETIFLYGVANSAFVAQSMELRLYRMGKIGSTITDSHTQLITSSIVDERSLIIAFSLTGATAEIYESLKIAKKNKAKIIVITNDFRSPIAKLATLNLQTLGIETPLDGGSVEGQISQLLVSDLICSAYANNNKKSVKLQKEKIADAIVKRNIQ